MKTVRVNEVRFDLTENDLRKFLGIAVLPLDEDYGLSSVEHYPSKNYRPSVDCVLRLVFRRHNDPGKVET